MKAILATLTAFCLSLMNLTSPHAMTDAQTGSLKQVIEQQDKELKQDLAKLNSLLTAIKEGQKAEDGATLVKLGGILGVGGSVVALNLTFPTAMLKGEAAGAVMLTITGVTLLLSYTAITAGNYYVKLHEQELKTLKSDLQLIHKNIVTKQKVHCQLLNQQGSNRCDPKAYDNLLALKLLNE